MPVDVVTEVEIDRPRDDVAAYASDPDNAATWYKNIESVEWRSPRPVAVGSKIAFVAKFLGRRLVYTYRIRELVPVRAVGDEHGSGAVPDDDHVHLGGRAKRWRENAPQKPRSAGRLLQVGRAHDRGCDPSCQSQGPRAAQGDSRGQLTLA